MQLNAVETVLKTSAHLCVEAVSALQHRRVIRVHVLVADDARILDVQLQKQNRYQQNIYGRLSLRLSNLILQENFGF